MLDSLAHALSVDEVVRKLSTDVENGLTRVIAEARLAADGPNEVVVQKPRAAWRILAAQFRSLLVGLLAIAVVIALAMNDRVEALAIGVVIVLNALLGFWTERTAARALEGLRASSVLSARVRRDGEDHAIAAASLVVGDVVVLAQGDRVPADGRVVAQTSLSSDESALTGESVPTAKSSEAVGGERVMLGDRTSMVYAGTVVASGHGRFVVTATGMATEAGRVGALVDEQAERRTPLELKLGALSRTLVVVVLLLCAFIVFLGWLRGNPLIAMIEVGISLAIAAVPEGLLAVTTVTLAVGMQRMARMNALVRRLPAVEALGSTTVICTDKTGTLTRNEMTASVLEVCGERVAITGTGYGITGALQRAGGPLVWTDGPRDERLRLALRIGALCNDAKVDRSHGKAAALGDPTEVALLVAAEKAGLSPAALEAQYPRKEEIPFSSETQRMVTVQKAPDGSLVAYVKGAPAAVLAACTSALSTNGTDPITPTTIAALQASNEALASEALRVLGLAYRTLPPSYEPADLGRDLTFVGLVGMADPLRPEARATIEACRGAGIRTIMITGDQLATAMAIGGKLGLRTGLSGEPMGAAHGRDLVGLSAHGWVKLLARTSVFARVSPEHKLLIVETLQRKGETVAMTGDGVNDAPALRRADVGIAMGVRGSEAAKEAADVVLVDDDFSTLVRAVEQGRVVVQNILRFVQYLFATNLAEITTVFGATLLGLPLPLAVLQILWLNLVTDVFPAMALALEPAAEHAMSEPPRDPGEPIISPRLAWLIAWQGGTMATCTLAAFGVALSRHGRSGAGLGRATTIAFMTLAMAQIAYAFSVRTRRRSLLAAGLFANRWLWGATALCVVLQVSAVTVPPLRAVLHTTPLVARDWQLVAVLALLPVVLFELVKLLERRRSAAIAATDV